MWDHVTCTTEEKGAAMDVLESARTNDLGALLVALRDDPRAVSKDRHVGSPMFFNEFDDHKRKKWDLKARGLWFCFFVVFCVWFFEMQGVSRQKKNYALFELFSPFFRHNSLYFLECDYHS